jgi:hypothetical protein
MKVHQASLVDEGIVTHDKPGEVDCKKAVAACNRRGFFLGKSFLHMLLTWTWTIHGLCPVASDEAAMLALGLVLDGPAKVPKARAMPSDGTRPTSEWNGGTHQ